MKSLYLLFVFLGVFASVLFAESVENQGEDIVARSNPYGVCAHLSQWEFKDAPQEISLISKAGIGAFRCDFDWSAVEWNKGVYNYGRFDKLTEMATSGGVDILAIIPGFVPKYACPFPKYIDGVAEFGARMVARYKSVKYWEMINEPNHPNFWGGLKPNPVEYREAIKKLYPALKKANPDATILYGGLSGVPLDYMEETFKDGGAKCFDVMNIHPYSLDAFPEDSLVEKIRATRAKLEKYGVGEKPIWITEMGYTSSSPSPCTIKYIARAVEILGHDVSKISVAYIGDEKYEFYSDALKGDVHQMIPNARKYKQISFKKLRSLSSEKYPVLFIGENEAFPYDYLDALYSYVESGGIVVSTGGIPFYFDIKIDKNGVAKRVEGLGRAGGKFLRLAHKSSNDSDISFVKPHLTNKGVDRGYVSIKESAKGFEDIKPDGHYYGRIFPHNQFVNEDDQFIPILYGVFDDKKIPLGAIYKYGGGIKGGFISMPARNKMYSSEEMQARLLPRQFILARSVGVEKVFYYSLRNLETDYTSESHFGIVKRNLEPKLPYQAYKTLTDTLDNAKPKVKNIDGIYIATWKKSDGTPVCALWTKMYERRVTLEILGKAKEVKNYLGVPLSYTQTDNQLRLKVCGDIVYLVGVKSAKPQ